MPKISEGIPTEFQRRKQPSRLCAEAGLWLPTQELLETEGERLARYGEIATCVRDSSQNSVVRLLPGERVTPTDVAAIGRTDQALAGRLVVLWIE